MLAVHDTPGTLPSILERVFDLVQVPNDRVDDGVRDDRAPPDPHEVLVWPELLNHLVDHVGQLVEHVDVVLLVIDVLFELGFAHGTESLPVYLPGVLDLL